MWIVVHDETGHSDESMRFAERNEALYYRAMTGNPEAYSLRFEFD